MKIYLIIDGEYDFYQMKEDFFVVCSSMTNLIKSIPGTNINKTTSSEKLNISLL